MRINNKLITLFNLIVSGLFLAPLRYLDLLHENYSTLTLNTKGYLYVLFLGIVIGLLSGYETAHISSKRNGIAVFLILVLGVLIPHQVPYDLQGNLHLLFAYASAFFFTALTWFSILRNPHPKLGGILMLGICASVLFYMKAMMVNCISEVILMCTLLFINWYLYVKG